MAVKAMSRLRAWLTRGATKLAGSASLHAIPYR
jgi:hypothetical protein